MNRDDLVRDTYAHFGLAVYKAQVLESGIVNAMVIARMPDRARITRADIDSFMDRQFKNTLGQLLRTLKKHVVVPDSVAGLLDQALSTRNWLAHDYFRERATEFVTEAGCHQMISELQGAQQLFSSADDQLGTVVRPIRERFGMTDEAIASEVQATMAGLGELDG